MLKKLLHIDKATYHNFSIKQILSCYNLSFQNIPFKLQFLLNVRAFIVANNWTTRFTRYMLLSGLKRAIWFASLLMRGYLTSVLDQSFSPAIYCFIFFWWSNSSKYNLSWYSLSNNLVVQCISWYIFGYCDFLLHGFLWRQLPLMHPCTRIQTYYYTAYLNAYTCCSLLSSKSPESLKVYKMLTKYCEHYVRTLK